MQLTPTCMLKALSSRQSFCSFFFSSFLASTLTLSVNAGSPTLLATNNRSLAPPRRLVRSPFICFPTCFFLVRMAHRNRPARFRTAKIWLQYCSIFIFIKTGGSSVHRHFLLPLFLTNHFALRTPCAPTNSPRRPVTLSPTPLTPISCSCSLAPLTHGTGLGLRCG